ncbi:MAG TPA: DUF4350 domain-containing protein [Mycobacteriales bacterium]|jgi:hypothetical protein|nr:DUF4350 domain-containing protein [Mycobacteriales bacterium]
MTAAVIDAPLDLRDVWHRWRGPICVAAFLIGAALILAIAGTPSPGRPLDPSDPSAGGGRALAQLVRDRGVEVVAVHEVSSAPLGTTATVFVPDPTSLTRSDLRSLADEAMTLVVIAPTDRELQALRVVATPLPHDEQGTVGSGCAFSPAAIAGRVRYDGSTYAAPAAQQQCYGNGAAAGLFVYDTGRARVVVLGSGRTLSNEWLGDEGDAALGLGLLSGSRQLLWVLPRPSTQAPSDTKPKGLLTLLPDRLVWATLQLVLAVIVLALWRARRIGPVVAEPLPVVVRATETVEGRARLLRAARARGTAGAALRAAAVERMRDRLGLAPDSGQAAVVESVCRHSGWRASDVEQVLFGPAPPGDTQLLRLSQELDQLDRAVRNGP